MKKAIAFKERLKQEDSQKIELLEAAETDQWNLFPSKNNFYIDLLRILSADELKIMLFKTAQGNQWDIFAKLVNNASDFKLLKSAFIKDDDNLTLYDRIMDSSEAKKLAPRKLQALYPLTSHNKPCILFFTTMMNGIGDLHNLVNVLSVFYQHPSSENYEVIVSISVARGKDKIINDQLEQLGLNTSLPNVFDNENFLYDTELSNKLLLAQQNNIEIIAQITVSICGSRMSCDADCREKIPRVYQVGFPEHGFISEYGAENLTNAGYHTVKGMGFFQSTDYHEYGLFLKPCELTTLDLFNYLYEHEPELTSFLLEGERIPPDIEEASINFTSSHLTIPLYLNAASLTLLNILSHIALDKLPFENICFITHEPVEEFITKNSKYDITIYNAEKKETSSYASNQPESNKKIKVVSNLWLPRKYYEILYKIAKVAFCKGPGTLELCIANQTLPIYFPVYPMQKKFLNDFHKYLIKEDYPQRFVTFIEHWEQYLIQIHYESQHEDLSDILENLFTNFFPREGDDEWLAITFGRLQEEMNFKNTISEVLERILSAQVIDSLKSSPMTIFSQPASSRSDNDKGKKEEILSLN